MKPYTFDYNRIIIEKNNILNKIKKDNIDSCILLRDFLLLYIIDYDNYYLPIENNNIFLDKMIQKLDNNIDYLIDIDEKKISKILNIITNYRIDNTLNEKIVLLLANYINNKDDNMITEIDMKELSNYCKNFDIE